MSDPHQRRAPGGIGRKRVQARASRVEMQIFAVVADRNRLQEFCDRYFNASIPPHIAYFRPAFPVVFCTMLYYPDMGDELRWRLGTLTQRELYFAVPLDAYRRRGDRWDFIEHALTTPYVFVDNSVSAIAGRERYGFPKQACEFSTEWAAPAGAPSDVEHVLTVSVWDPSPAGQHLRPLMHVVRNNSTRPTGGEPIGGASRARPGSVSMEYFLWLARTIAGEIKARTSPGPLAEASGQLREFREAWQDGTPCMNAYNLRQFADPSFKGSAFYQDLIRFRMAITPHTGGLLSERWITRNQYQLLIHRTDVRPIVERLGLQVSARHFHNTPGGRATLDTLDSIVALHASGDAELLRVDRLCWRSQNGGWFTNENQPASDSANCTEVAYNDLLGPGAAAFLEPQPREQTLDVQYFMLPARADTVGAYLDEVRPPECAIAIEPVTAGDLTAVRIVASRSRPPSAGEEEELVWLDGDYLSITVPVQYRMNGETHCALMMLYDFTDNSFMLQSLRELACSTTAGANFCRDSRDLGSPIPGVSRVLRVDALAIDRNANEALITPSRLIDIFALTHRGTDTPQTAYAPLMRDLWDIVSEIQPIISFGSIPKPDDPLHASVRRLVLTHRSDHEIVDRREQDQSTAHFVQFHDSETYPLVRRLGLIAMPPDSSLTLRLRDNIAGRTGVVPVVAMAQAGLRVGDAEMRTLWHDLRPFSGDGGVAGTPAQAEIR